MLVIGTSITFNVYNELPYLSIKLYLSHDGFSNIPIRGHNKLNIIIS